MIVSAKPLRNTDLGGCGEWLLEGRGPAMSLQDAPPPFFLLIQLIQVYRGHEHDVDSRGLGVDSHVSTAQAHVR